MAITDKDVDKLKQVFATKDELADVKGELKVFRNEMNTKLDKVMGELEKAREDRIFAKAKDDELEKRLETVEAKIR